MQESDRRAVEELDAIFGVPTMVVLFIVGTALALSALTSHNWLNTATRAGFGGFVAIGSGIWLYRRWWRR